MDPSLVFPALGIDSSKLNFYRIKVLNSDRTAGGFRTATENWNTTMEWSDYSGSHLGYALFQPNEILSAFSGGLGDNPAVWLVETEPGHIVKDECSKDVYYQRARLVHRFTKWTAHNSRLFACDCVERVIGFATEGLRGEFTNALSDYRCFAEPRKRHDMWEFISKSNLLKHKRGLSLCTWSSQVFIDNAVLDALCSVGIWPWFVPPNSTARLCSNIVDRIDRSKRDTESDWHTGRLLDYIIGILPA